MVPRAGAAFLSRESAHGPQVGGHGYEGAAEEVAEVIGKGLESSDTVEEVVAIGHRVPDLSGAGHARTVARTVIGGALAMTVTYGIGHLAGITDSHQPTIPTNPTVRHARIN